MQAGFAATYLQVLPLVSDIRFHTELDLLTDAPEPKFPVVECKRVTEDFDCKQPLIWTWCSMSAM